MTEQEALDALAHGIAAHWPDTTTPDHVDYEVAGWAAEYLHDHPDVARALGICQPMPWYEHMPPAQKVEFDDD